jgi:hypothetical protein
MTALQELTEKVMEVKRAKYSSVPSHAIARTNFEDKSTNGLTHCVLTWLTIHSHYVSRIQSQGQYRESIGRFTRSTTRRGIGDLFAVVNGKTLMIEIKAGKDRLSKFQIQTQKDIEASGAHYWVIRSFEEFLKQYKHLLTLKHKYE